MIRLDQNCARGAERLLVKTGTGLEVILLRSVSERCKDIARDIETSLGEGLAQIMLQITQPLRRQSPEASLRP